MTHPCGFRVRFLIFLRSCVRPGLEVSLIQNCPLKHTRKGRAGAGDRRPPRPGSDSPTAQDALLWRGTRQRHARERHFLGTSRFALRVALADLSRHHHRLAGRASGNCAAGLEGARPRCAGRLVLSCVSGFRYDHPHCRGGRQLGHGQVGTPQAHRLRPAGKERLWLEILGRRRVGVRRRLSFDSVDFSGGGIFTRFVGASWRGSRASRSALAAGLPGHRVRGGVPFPWLLAIHLDARHRLLARRISDFIPLRRASLFHETLRALAGLGLDWPDRLAALPDAAAYGRTALRHWIPCGV